MKDEQPEIRESRHPIHPAYICIYLISSSIYLPDLGTYLLHLKPFQHYPATQHGHSWRQLTRVLLRSTSTVPTTAMPNTIGSSATLVDRILPYQPTNLPTYHLHVHLGVLGSMTKNYFVVYILKLTYNNPRFPPSIPILPCRKKKHHARTTITITITITPPCPRHRLRRRRSSPRHLPETKGLQAPSYSTKSAVWGRKLVVGSGKLLMGTLSMLNYNIVLHLCFCVDLSAW